MATEYPYADYYADTGVAVQPPARPPTEDEKAKAEAEKAANAMPGQDWLGNSAVAGAEDQRGKHDELTSDEGDGKETNERVDEQLRDVPIVGGIYGGIADMFTAGDRWAADQRELAMAAVNPSFTTAGQMAEDARAKAEIALGYQGPGAIYGPQVTGPTALDPAAYRDLGVYKAYATDATGAMRGYDASLAQAADATNRTREAAFIRAAEATPASISDLDTRIAAPEMGQAAQTGRVGVERVATSGLSEDLRAREIAAAERIATGPSAAMSQFQAGQTQVVSDALAQAAAARGSERAAARRQAILATSSGGAQANLQAAALAAQEEQQRRVAAASAMSGIRAQDVQSSTATAQIAAQQANLQAQLDAAIAQGNTEAANAIRTRQAELTLAARQASLQGALTQQGTQAEIAQANLSAAQQTIMANAANANKAQQDYAAAWNAAAGQAAQSQTTVSLANAGAQTTAAKDYAAAINTAGQNFAAANTAASEANATLAQKQASEGMSRGLQAGTANQAQEQAAKAATAANQLDASKATASNQLDTERTKQQAAQGYLGAANQALGVQTEGAKIVTDAAKQGDGGSGAAGLGAIGSIVGAIASDERVKDDITPVGAGKRGPYEEFADRKPNPFTGESADKYRFVGAGNIPLNERPLVRNDDGSVSTVYSMGFGNDEKGYVLVPGVRHGLDRKMTDEEAYARYASTGEHLGKFKKQEEADAYAEALHRQQEVIYPEALVATSDERAKRAVEKMDREQIIDWARAAAQLPVSYRYKPGVEDDGRNAHVGVLAQDLEATGPLGQLMVQKNPDTGTKTVDYGAAALMLSKAAFDLANESYMRRQKEGR